VRRAVAGRIDTPAGDVAVVIEPGDLEAALEEARQQ